MNPNRSVVANILCIAWTSMVIVSAAVDVTATSMITHIDTPSMSSFRCSGPILSAQHRGELASAIIMSQELLCERRNTHRFLNGSFVIETVAW